MSPSSHARCLRLTASSFFSEFGPSDYRFPERPPPQYVATATIPSTLLVAPPDEIYNEHNYPHNVKFQDIEEELQAAVAFNSAEEDNDSTRSSDSEPCDESGMAKPSRKLKRVKRKTSRDPKELGMQSGRFQCELASLEGSKKAGPNEHIAKVFDELGKFNEEDQWRSMAYRKASAALRRWKKPIKTVDDAKGIFGVGDRR